MKNAALGLLFCLAVLSSAASAQIARPQPGVAGSTFPGAPATSAAAPAPAGVGVASSSYVLGPDDVIEVSVLGRPEMTQQTRIKPDGSIVLPLLGSVKASGNTILTLADEIGKKMEKAGLLRNPIINVEVIQMVSQTATVLGKVSSPGVVPLDREMTVSSVLGKVGGALPTGAGYVVVQKKDGTQKQVVVADLIKGGEFDPVVEGGDTLFVPDAEIFYIYGQINQPGAQPLRANMTLRQAIGQAGGPTAMGSDKRVRINRGGKEFKAKLDDVIQKDDVIVVKERIF
jgi:polysaccharide export outer membrane protein